MASYLVIIEKGKNNFSAYSPDVPGCVASGKTVEITLNTMYDALSLHLEDLQQQGEIIPTPRGFNAYNEFVANIGDGDLFTYIRIDPDFLLKAA